MSRITAAGPGRACEPESCLEAYLGSVDLAPWTGWHGRCPQTWSGDAPQQVHFVASDRETSNAEEPDCSRCSESGRGWPGRETLGVAGPGRGQRGGLWTLAVKAEESCRVESGEEWRTVREKLAGEDSEEHYQGPSADDQLEEHRYHPEDGPGLEVVGVC